MLDARKKQSTCGMSTTNVVVVVVEAAGCRVAPPLDVAQCLFVLRHAKKKQQDMSHNEWLVWSWKLLRWVEQRKNKLFSPDEKT